MKNILAMTQAIISQSLRNARSMDEAAQTITGRIQALSEAQNVLVTGPSQQADIKDVLRQALQPHEDKAGRFSLDGPTSMLSSAQTLGLSLAVHELGTNAAKYGALSNGTGSIAIAWSIDAADRFQIEWKETRGPSVKAPERSGFGSRLTQRIVASYFHGAGAIAFESDGVRFTLIGRLEKEGPDKVLSSASEGTRSGQID